MAHLRAAVIALLVAGCWHASSPPPSTPVSTARPKATARKPARAAAPLAGTTWQFCGPTIGGGPERITLNADGTLTWDSTCSGKPCDCGNSRWTQDGSHASFDCNQFTQWDVTIDGDRMNGEWFRVKDPDDRSDTCLKRVRP